MPKWLDYINPIKAIAMAINPIGPVIVSVVEAVFTKPKKKAIKMIDGKKTVIGIVVAIVPMVAKLFGYDVTTEFTTGAETSINELVALVGGLYALYGRAVTNGKPFFAKK